MQFSAPLTTFGGSYYLMIFIRQSCKPEPRSNNTFHAVKFYKASFKAQGVNLHVTCMPDIGLNQVKLAWLQGASAGRG